MKYQVALVLLLATLAWGAEQKSEGRDKRAVLTYNYAAAYPYSYNYPYYSAPYTYSPYYVSSPYTSAAYVAAPSAAYTYFK